MAYVLLLENWQRQAIADRQALIALGVREGLPTFGEVRRRLDEALLAEPDAPESEVDSEQMELRRALGVA